MVGKQFSCFFGFKKKLQNSFCRAMFQNIEQRSIGGHEIQEMEN